MPLPTPYPVVGGTTIASAWGTSVVDGLPQIGFVGMWVGDNAPPDYLLCRGQAVSRTTYLALWNLCKTPSGIGRFGDGDGSTTFNVPDLRGRYPFGHNVGPASSLNPDAGSFGQSGVGQVFGNKDATGVYPHQHGVPNHIHPVNIWSGYVNIDHHHLMSLLEGPAGGAVGAFGFSRVGDWTTAGSGYGYTHPMNQNQNIRVPINGATDGSGDFATTPGGTDISLRNLPPSLSLNFVVRYA